MATASEITEVRVNTGLLEDVAPYTDDYISGIIDASSVSGATATVWRSLAASYSTKVDVTEAGASHKFSDLFKNASAMAKLWGEAAAGEGTTAANRPRVNYIVRE